jgi:hypothetical protein
MFVTRIAAVAIASLGLCGCDDDKSLVLRACNKKAHADAVQMEKWASKLMES